MLTVMKTRFPLLAACLLAFASQAQQTNKEIWKWTDADGVVHYSDAPGPARSRWTSRSPGRTGPGQRSRRLLRDASGSPRDARCGSHGHLLLARNNPAGNETSYFEADTLVNVQIHSDPALAEETPCCLYLDGKRVEGPRATRWNTRSLVSSAARTRCDRTILRRPRARRRSAASPSSSTSSRSRPSRRVRWDRT